MRLRSSPFLGLLGRSTFSWDSLELAHSSLDSVTLADFSLDSVMLADSSLDFWASWNSSSLVLLVVPLVVLLGFLW